MCSRVYANILEVNGWSGNSGAITGRAHVTTGSVAVSDPRVNETSREVSNRLILEARRNTYGHRSHVTFWKLQWKCWT